MAAFWGDGADLAGKGIYFEADPFSSQSYGDHLVIAFLKPSQPAKDVRTLGELTMSKSSVTWEPFDSCDEFSADELSSAIKAFRKAGALRATTSAASACELKAQLIADFKKSTGYKRYLSVFTYLQRFKRQLGIKSLPGESSALVSTLSATCR